MDTLSATVLWSALAAGFFASLGASLLGNFVILQRVSLAADVLSHVALPGIAVALALHLHPFLGGFTFLMLAALAIWRLETRTRLPFDTLIGILFTVALAVGQILFRGHEGQELLEALFGSLGTATFFDVAIAAVAGSIIVSIFALRYRPFVLSLISADLARVQGIRAERMKLLFLLMLALAVAVGIKVTGILFVGALLIFPAAIAGNMCRGFKGALAVSMTVGTLGTLAGIAGGFFYGVDPGASIILILAGLFVVSVLLRPRVVRNV